MSLQEITRHRLAVELGSVAIVRPWRVRGIIGAINGKGGVTPS